ncbi:peptidase dimerization protein [Clostridium sp. Cult2]|nr:M20 family metallopeptidase [Clostridium sp. Cult2]MCF6465964.1 peptidase dimerization protein [Clostridium sp. Cult2]
MLNMWEELVNIDSGSSDKEGVDTIAEKLKKYYDEIGFSTKVIEFNNAGNSLIAEVGAERQKKGILFIGHMDTVFKAGTVNERPFKIENGKAYGPGVLDMKGGLVVEYFAAKALQKVGYYDRPIKVIISGDEEVAHVNSDKGKLFIRESEGYAATFNCEPGYLDNGIVVGRKGVAKFTMEIHGVSAHAGSDPEKGSSAILEAAHKIIDIHKLTNFEEGTTYNVGVIHGGTVSNAVPDYVKLKIDVRFLDLDKTEEIISALKDVTNRTYIVGTKSILSGGVSFKPMETTEGIMKLFEHYKKTSIDLGYEMPYPKKSGGGSDAANTVIAGVPSICAVGVKGSNDHSPKEEADIESMFERTKVLIASVLTYDKDC